MNSKLFFPLLLLFLFSIPRLVPGQEYFWTTLAGKPGGEGSADGLGGKARFSAPMQTAVDGSGNVYVADWGNHTIRKITPAGEVTTLAGRAGSTGSTNGTGSAARFNFPTGVAVNAAGTVYVADQDNRIIRKITPAAPGSPLVQVTTLAGLAGAGGLTDGTGNAARFGGIERMTVDGNGNILVADTGRIRKITPAGVVTTLPNTMFTMPRSLAVDGSGNVYVADYGSHTISKIVPDGTVVLLAGQAGTSGSTDGVGSAARFYAPDGVAVDVSGNVYVADSVNKTIRKITPAGDVSTLAGAAGQYGYVDGAGNAARFQRPAGLAMGGDGHLYVAEFEGDTIRRISPAGVVTTFAGSAVEIGSTDGFGTAARFSGLEGLAVDGSGNVYASDYRNHTIRKITPAGQVTTLAGQAGSAGSTDGTGPEARFLHPDGLAVAADGTLFVADRENKNIRKITPGGVVTTLAGAAGIEGSQDGTGIAARFHSPNSLALDGSGNLYVTDLNNHTIRKITPNGVVTTLAGRAGFSGTANGQGAAARFSLPCSITVDGTGMIYVTENENHAIRKITPGGLVSTFAGQVGTYGFANGSGGAARFTYPNDGVLDAAGTLFVADSGNGLIRRITPAGVVSTLAGKLGSGPFINTDGSDSEVSFNPVALALDSIGDFYVIDLDRARIRKRSRTPLPTFLEHWRQLHFGSAADSGDGADAFDFDRDGLVNLLEFGLGLDPKTGSVRTCHMDRTGGGLEFTYTRSTAAFAAGTQFAVEWTDDLSTGTWSTAGVTSTLLTDDGLLQHIKAILPPGPAGHRFARLKITAP